MRNRALTSVKDHSILICDDEIGIVDSLKVVLGKLGYRIYGVTDPYEAIEMVKDEQIDLLILDYLMDSINGNKVVEKIREFNKKLFILLLTGHKDLAPPVDTLKSLDIQAYCEKSDKFDQLILLVESAIKSIKLMQLNKKYEDGISSILEAIPQIYQLQPIDVILKKVLSHMLPLSNTRDAFILIDHISTDDDTHESFFNGIGCYNESLDLFFAKIEPEMLEKIGLARNESKTISDENGFYFPLINDNKKSMGVIFVKDTNYQDSIRLLEIYALNASVSISNAYLHSLVNIKKEELKFTYEELKKYYLDIVEALRLTVDAKDIYTRGHSDRVSFYSTEIGKALELSDKEIEFLRLGGLFHDIGKIGTSDDILYKTSKLDDKEYEEIKKHPLKGSLILSAISMFNDVVPIIKCHHEKMDGTGYPQGLKGEEIPLLARIVSVADAFDAITSDRLYRTKLSTEDALSILNESINTQFDKNIVAIFDDLIRSKYDLWQNELAYSFE